VNRLVRVFSFDESAVTSTPVISDGALYFGTWNGRAIALNADSGCVIWQTEVVTDGQFDATPLVTLDRVYLGDSKGALHALSKKDGKVIWSVQLDPNPYAHLYSSPVLVPEENTIVIGVASIEVAFVLQDYTFRGSIVALDASTGIEKWRTYLTNNNAISGAGVSVWSSAVVDASRKLVFIGTGQNYEPPASDYSDALIALDYRNGDIVWHRQFTANDVFTIFGADPKGPDWDVGATPNLFTITIDGQAMDVVGVGDKRGVYAVLRRDDGATVWARQLTEGSHLGGVMTTAAVEGNAIYVTSNKWVEPLFPDNPPAGATSEAFSLDATTGSIRWRRELSAPSFGGVEFRNGVMFAGTIRGIIYALDGENGDILWTDQLERMGGRVKAEDSMLFVPHGFVFFQSTLRDAKGGLVAYRVP
jgi:polyvinyl alcohol dehydrogenase (cytochrome)